MEEAVELHFLIVQPNKLESVPYPEYGPERGKTFAQEMTVFRDAPFDRQTQV